MLSALLLLVMTSPCMGAVSTTMMQFPALALDCVEERALGSVTFPGVMQRNNFLDMFWISDRAVQVGLIFSISVPDTHVISNARVSLVPSDFDDNNMLDLRMAVENTTSPAPWSIDTNGDLSQRAFLPALPFTLLGNQPWVAQQRVDVGVDISAQLNTLRALPGWSETDQRVTVRIWQDPAVSAGAKRRAYRKDTGTNGDCQASCGPVLTLLTVQDAPTTLAPTTSPTTEEKPTTSPSTGAPTTATPTTAAPTTPGPTDANPTSLPTTRAPTTRSPTTRSPTTRIPTTRAPTTRRPTTRSPTTRAPTTRAPTTAGPTNPPGSPSSAPTTRSPTTRVPTASPTTIAPSAAPTTAAPSQAPTTLAPGQTAMPTTGAPTTTNPPTTRAPTVAGATTSSDASATTAPAADSGIGVIVGAIVGGLLFLGLVALLIVFLVKCNQANSYKDSIEIEDGPAFQY